MTEPHALAGVVAADGPARAEDLRAFATARLQLIHLRASLNPVHDVLRWREAGATASIYQLLSPTLAQRRVSPQEFTDLYADEVTAFLEQGGTHVEIQTEPNRADQGAGISWQDGASFGRWFLEVLDEFKRRFGAAVQVGFPALAPTRLARLELAAQMDDTAFLDACADALLAADWAALHVYWRTLAEMRDVDGALSFAHNYLERFPKQTFIISEFANVAANVSAQARGAQYAEFLTLAAQYDQLQGACGLLLRSTDPRYGALGWLSSDGEETAVISILARRPKMPAAGALWLSWPTETWRYGRYFGQNQIESFSAYQAAGGHDGVDLAVAAPCPETSPIYAALPGTVCQVAFDESGYGHHVRVRSYGSQGEEIILLYAHLSRIEVTAGTLMQRGDLLGWAGATGECTDPHLHLGMRVRDVNLPAVLDYVNPRPYLNARPRGLPIQAYQRTYVLLPPGADTAWACAVVRATWERYRFTLGGNADDAGIGHIGSRHVIAVNPHLWKGNLEAFFSQSYPGVNYVSISAAEPADLERRLGDFPPLEDNNEDFDLGFKGLPREPYLRIYVLLPPAADAAWALATIEATWDRHRLTIGSNVDDAAIGDLPGKRVIAINPEQWGFDVTRYYAAHYPEVTALPVRADTPARLAAALAAALDQG